MPAHRDYSDFLRQKGLLAPKNLFPKINYYGASVQDLGEHITTQVKGNLVCQRYKGLSGLEMAKASQDIQPSQDDVLRLFYDVYDTQDYGSYGPHNRTCLLARTKHVVFDLDVKHGKDGVRAFKSYCEKHKVNLPNTFTTITKSDGQHVYLKLSNNYTFVAANYDNVLDGVDIKLESITAPYSVSYDKETYGKVYKPVNDNAEIQPCPPALERLILKQQYNRAMRRTISNRKPWRPIKKQGITLKRKLRTVLLDVIQNLKPEWHQKTELWNKVMFHLCIVCGDDNDLRAEMCHHFSQPWQFYKQQTVQAWVDRWVVKPEHSKKRAMQTLLQYVKTCVDADTYAEMVERNVNVQEEPAVERGQEEWFGKALLDPSLNIRYDKKIDKRFIDLEDLPRDKKLVILKSCMGSGKTTLMIKMITQWFQDSRILIVSSRCSLDRQLVREINKHVPANRQFSLYSEAKGRNGKIIGTRQVCQVDSIHGVEGEFDLMIVDEPRGVIQQVCGVRDNAGNVKTSAFDAFWQRVQTTPQVFLTDAFVDDATIQQFEASKGHPAYVIWNTYQRYVGERGIVYDIDTDAEYILRALKHVENDKKLMCPCSSKEVAVNLRNDITHKFKDRRVLLITADTHDTKDIAVEAWVNYDVVIFSPTILYGLSFDEPHFDRVVGYCDDYIMSSVDMVQMVKRARVNKDMMTEIYHKQTRPTHQLLTSEKAYDHYAQNLDNSKSEFAKKMRVGSYDYVLQRPKPDMWYTVNRHNQVQKDRDSMMMCQRMAGLLETQGMKVDIVRPSANLNKKDRGHRNAVVKSELDAKYDHTDVKRDYKANMMQKLVETEPIIKEEFERLIELAKVAPKVVSRKEVGKSIDGVPYILEKTDALSDVERRKILRYRYEGAYGKTMDENDIDNIKYELTKERALRTAHIQRDIAFVGSQGHGPEVALKAYKDQYVKVLAHNKVVADTESNELYDRAEKEAMTMQGRAIGHEVCVDLKVDYGMIAEGDIHSVRLEPTWVCDVLKPALEKHLNQVNAVQKCLYNPAKVGENLNIVINGREWTKEEREEVRKAKQHLKRMSDCKQDTTSQKCIDKYRLYVVAGKFRSRLVDAYEASPDASLQWNYVKKSSMGLLNRKLRPIGLEAHPALGNSDVWIIGYCNGRMYDNGVKIPAGNSQLWNIISTGDRHMSAGAEYKFSPDTLEYIDEDEERDESEMVDLLD